MDKQITGCTLLTSENNSIAVGTEKLLDCRFAYFICYLKPRKKPTFSKTHFPMSQTVLLLKGSLIQIHRERTQEQMHVVNRVVHYPHQKRSHTVVTLVLQSGSLCCALSFLSQNILGSFHQDSEGEDLGSYTHFSLSVSTPLR